MRQAAIFALLLPIRMISFVAQGAESEIPAGTKFVPAMKVRLILNISAIIISSLLITSCTNRGISVHITNESEYLINELIMEFTGGSRTLPELSPGDTLERTINPGGESSLNIRYKIGKNSYIYKADIYLEQNSKGNIYVKIIDKENIILDYKPDYSFK